MVHVSASGRCTLRDFYLCFSAVEFKIKYKRIFRLKVTSSLIISKCLSSIHLLAISTMFNLRNTLFVRVIIFKK